MKNYVLLFCGWLIMIFTAGCTGQKKLQGYGELTSNEILEIINRVNENWQVNNPPQQRSFWDVAVYHTGNMEAYFLTKNEDFRKYSESWGEYNQWMGAKGADRSKWKYTYGEGENNVLFGDWQICFQTYIDLYELQKDEKKIARAREVMEYEMGTSGKNYWWWVDGLYMVMPVMTKLYQVTGNKLYLDKMYEYWSYSNSIMYDSQEKLYYRDTNFIYPKHMTASGKKDFWSRGDGWVFAALAKVIKDLPTDYDHREEFVKVYKDMAKTLSKTQHQGGYWTRSILDTAYAPGPETSGTALFTYGLIWGVNNGYLSNKEFQPIIMKGWQYLARVALQPNGRVGYVQPIGARAIPGQMLNQNSTANFGVGAFLLAACEMYRYVNNRTMSLVKKEDLKKNNLNQP